MPGVFLTYYRDEIAHCKVSVLLRDNTHLKKIQKNWVLF